jgi:GntR family transcriptional regulator, transcriptional repressor for pyruvate dehydrogenase complex
LRNGSPSRSIGTEKAMGGSTAKDSSNYALKRIRELVEPAALGPNRKLPTERALCEMLEISRRSVRRALEVLEAEGRIWRRQGSGTFVGRAPLPILSSIEEVAKKSNYVEVMQVRLQLEPGFAALAALRAAPADVEKLRNLVERIDHSRDADERELWDSSLHRTVAEIAGNHLYLAIFDLVDRVRQEAAWVELRERARSSRTQRLYHAQHSAIVDAIATGDAVAANAAMRAHLLVLQENLERLTLPEATDAS